MYSDANTLTCIVCVGFELNSQRYVGTNALTPYRVSKTSFSLRNDCLLFNDSSD